jgi:hypothetical protein
VSAVLLQNKPPISLQRKENFKKRRRIAPHLAGWDETMTVFACQFWLWCILASSQIGTEERVDRL